MKKIDMERYFENEHLNDEARALFCDAMLFGKEDRLPVSIRDHVESCNQCKQQIIALYEVMKRDKIVRNNQIHPYFGKTASHKTKIFKLGNFMKIAAVAVLLLGLGSLLYYVVSIRNNSSTNSQITIITDSIKNNIVENQIPKKQNTDSASFSKSDSVMNSSMHQDELAVNMKESILFENLIASHYRSNDIEVSFPSLNYTFRSGQNIFFKFKGNITESLSLILYSNKGKRIIEKNDILTDSLYLNNQLQNGLFYWKLLQGDDLLQVGKFFVK